MDENISRTVRAAEAWSLVPSGAAPMTGALSKSVIAGAFFCVLGIAKEFPLGE
jgi:hypothetical protein